ncbi:MAG: DoxX family protein [Candidatus Liptonbacteria bacterium]|nr:DoxX family protein [Candidatus Liptonbacteria bacterium]
MFPLLYIWSDWGILILRVFFGAIIVVHGWPKIRNWEETARNFEAMGFKPGNVLGPIVAILEFFGGIALMAGFYTQLIAALLVVQFIVATIWKIKNGQKLVGGWELDLMLLGAAVLFTVLGGGAFSLDHLLFMGSF